MVYAILLHSAVRLRTRDRTLQHLDALSHVFDYQKPEGAYFVFPRVKISCRARVIPAGSRSIFSNSQSALVPASPLAPA